MRTIRYARPLCEYWVKPGRGRHIERNVASSWVPRSSAEIFKMSKKQTPSDFLKQIIGRPVVVKLNNGVDYRGKAALCLCTCELSPVVRDCCIALPYFCASDLQAQSTTSFY